MKDDHTYIMRGINAVSELDLDQRGIGQSAANQLIIGGLQKTGKVCKTYIMKNEGKGSGQNNSETAMYAK